MDNMADWLHRYMNSQTQVLDQMPITMSRLCVFFFAGTRDGHVRRWASVGKYSGADRSSQNGHGSGRHSNSKQDFESAKKRGQDIFNQSSARRLHD